MAVAMDRRRHGVDITRHLAKIFPILQTSFPFIFFDSLLIKPTRLAEKLVLSVLKLSDSRPGL